jgi:hypothetical protein
MDTQGLNLWLTSIQSTSFQAKEVTVWGPSTPRIVAGAWQGVGGGRGQIRIRGRNAPVQVGNRYAVQGVHSIPGREVFEGRVRQNQQLHSRNWQQNDIIEKMTVFLSFRSPQRLLMKDWQTQAHRRDRSTMRRSLQKWWQWYKQHLSV